MTQLRDRLVKRIAAAIESKDADAPSAIADTVLETLAEHPPALAAVVITSVSGAEVRIGPDHPRAAQIAELLRFADPTVG